MKRKMTAIIDSILAIVGGTLPMFEIAGGTLPVPATIANTNGQHQIIVQNFSNAIVGCMSRMTDLSAFGVSQEQLLRRKEIAAIACQNAAFVQRGSRIY